MSRMRMNVQAPIARMFAERWSPRAFDLERPVSLQTVALCLEAARWAPSCYGEQPWRFVVVDRFADGHADGGQWAALLETLAAPNRDWAARASVLIVAVTQRHFSHNGQPNRWAAYDLGQALMSLTLQASDAGLASHQMGGFDADAVAQLLAIPDTMSVMSITALGYLADPSVLPESLQQIETAPRTRKPLQELVHAGQWGAAWQPPAAAGWEARYQESPLEQLPWFYDALDADMAEALQRLQIDRGRLLDIGCGPGTQSVALAELGFQVTATDISATAVQATRQRAAEAGVSIDVQVDNVLESGLCEPFDLIIDRGVCHSFADPADQQRYLATMARLLKAGGYLLLKCFHKDERGEIGPPCRYDEADIHRLFDDAFALEASWRTQFSSDAMSEAPQALFAMLKKR